MKPQSRILLGALALALLLPATGEEPLHRELSRSERRWVDRTLKRMTVPERVGQLLMVPYFGEFSNTESEDFQSLVRTIQELKVGGLVVATKPRRPFGASRTDIYDLSRLTDRLQALADVPLLVSADFERGAAFRIEGSTDFPYAMAVGATGDPQFAYEMGQIAAQEARAVGVHWILAPVADVNSNPENPIINTRAFGEDPELVAEMVAAFVRGAQEHGVMATVKHFPGHGDTAIDSHLQMPVLTADRERLSAVELVPFRAAISAGVSAIMPGHLAVPSIENGESIPATFSERLLTGMLRDEMGFKGIVVTDAMVMNALTDLSWDGEAAVRAVEAGADIILMPRDARVAYEALLRAVRSGRISEERLEASVRRILSAKAQLQLHENSHPALEAPEGEIRTEAAEQAALRMAERGIVLLRDEPSRIPLPVERMGRGFLFVVSADPSSFPGDVLEQELKPRTESLITLRMDFTYFPPEEIKLPSTGSYDWAVVAVYVRVVSEKGEIGLPEGMGAKVREVLASGKPTVLIVLGSPYVAEHIPEAGTVLLTFSTADVSERAAVRALTGQAAITGSLPVTIPATAELGAGLKRAERTMRLLSPDPADSSRFEQARDLLIDAVRNGTTPGGVLAVGYQGRLAELYPFGRFTYEEGSPRVKADTLYDLASLTKVVGTTTAAMMLAERGRLRLDVPVAHYLPEFARGPDSAAKEKITVLNLLTHSSGLPPYVRFFLEVKNRAEILDRIHLMKLDYPTGAKSEYSDLGIILLGEIIERVTGRPLDEYYAEAIFRPLGMDHTLYNPPEGMREDIAPTEYDREFRKHTVHGEVHDENAWVMGGVAPHAGLFSTAEDLAAFCQMMLNRGIYAHTRLIRPDTVDFFAARRDIPESTRAIGWDTPSEEDSSGGHFLSRRAYGHTGFTGTSIWIDPEKELFVILLTNRVHPTRENNQIRGLRPAVHDAVIRALGLDVAAPAGKVAKSR